MPSARSGPPTEKDLGNFGLCGRKNLIGHFVALPWWMNDGCLHAVACCGWAAGWGCAGAGVAGEGWKVHDAACVPPAVSARLWTVRGRKKGWTSPDRRGRDGRTRSGRDHDSVVALMVSRRAAGVFAELVWSPLACPKCHRLQGRGRSGRAPRQLCQWAVTRCAHATKVRVRRGAIERRRQSTAFVRVHRTTRMPERMFSRCTSRPTASGPTPRVSSPTSDRPSSRDCVVRRCQSRRFRPPLSGHGDAEEF